MVFCNLFNSGYLDKAIVMSHSLEKACGNDFKLYIVAFAEVSHKFC